ncbi:MAG: DUF4240 domain-containing protein [Woeseiaceae bacterium]
MAVSAIMQTILGLFLIAIVLRFVYRFVIDFPPYPGKSPLQGMKVDGLMGEDEFWALIDESRHRSRGNYPDQVARLTELLEHKRLNEIISFNMAFEALMARVDRFRYWEPVYALNWGCSDDCFIDFRAWWIGQGKNKFYWSVRLPRLLYFFAVRDSVVEYEGLQYCAGDAYKNLNGREIPATDIEYPELDDTVFNENYACLKYPEMAFLAW